MEDASALGCFRLQPMRALSTALLLVAVLTACGPRTPRPIRRPAPLPLAEGVTVFERVNLVRMDRDVVLPDQSVIVDNGRIVHVGPTASTSIPTGAFRVDSRGRYLMPALADMHVQLSPNAWR